MSVRRDTAAFRTLIAAAAIGLLAASCGSDSGDSESAANDDGAAAATSNACPADGCQIGFASIEASGEELAVTWDINFAPDFARNHIHVYWDVYEPQQVSGDAADNGFEQGEWVPTDLSPTYVTEGAASTSVRGASTTLCVVAADGDHNVIDPASEVCQDVSDLLN